MKVATLIPLILAATSAAAPTSSRQHDGLSAQLRVGSATVAMGDAVDFNATVTLDTTLAPPAVRLINRFTGECEIIFEDAAGHRYTRRPFTKGMRRTDQPGDVARMKHGVPVSLEEMRIYLLSETGEQIPAGTYVVHMIYSQDAQNRTEAYRDNAGQYRTRTYAGPLEFWKGELDSEPCTLKVLPASPGEVEVRIPTAMLVDTTTISLHGHGNPHQHPRPQIAWSCSPDSIQVVRLVKRPGYALGQKWKLETWVDGQLAADYPRGLGGLLESGGRNFFHPDLTTRVLAAKRTEFVLHIEVFESSVQQGHLWQPEDGDYKTLWTGVVRHVFSASSK